MPTPTPGYMSVMEALKMALLGNIVETCTDVPTGGLIARHGWEQTEYWALAFTDQILSTSELDGDVFLTPGHRKIDTEIKC